MKAKQVLKYIGISQCLPIWFAIIALVRHKDILIYYLEGLILTGIVTLIVYYKPGIEEDKSKDFIVQEYEQHGYNRDSIKVKDLQWASIMSIVAAISIVILAIIYYFR